MSAGPRVGLFGGTFDPIHNGHLSAARAAQDALHLSRVLFIPAARPPHRPDRPQASEYHRVEMIRRAVAAHPGWEVCDLELQRSGPSFTFDTLAMLHRQGLEPLQLFFITGADAFADIATWHRYPAVLDAAHFVVVTRSGFSLAALRARLPEVADRMIEASELDSVTSTRIILVRAATDDVSATEVRQRAARGEVLTGFVPPEVGAYIAEHHLYRESNAAPGN